MEKKIETVFFSNYHNQFEDFKFDRENLDNSILKAFETLTQREVEVLILRFGLFGHKAQTLKEIGLNACNLDSGKIGITQERIRQIEAKALRKLRHPARRHFFE